MLLVSWFCCNDYKLTTTVQTYNSEEFSTCFIGRYVHLHTEDRKLLNIWSHSLAGRKLYSNLQNNLQHCTENKAFAMKNFVSKCDQIRSFLRVWSHLLKESLMENFIFCAMQSKCVFSSGVLFNQSVAKKNYNPFIL